MSHITMDLELDEEQLGTFGIFAQGTHQYNETHAHLISLIHAPLAVTISNILKHQEIQRLQEMLADDNRYLQQQMMEMTGDIIIGANFGLKDVMQMVRQVAPLDSPVLLMGETGVGKEVIANAIHHSSQRRGGPCIKVNCGAIAENLIDSELFGHEKGAFTGAVSTKRGRFERAHNGTIFLDEIGELPLQAQVRLLRVLQHHEIERVGGSEPIEVNVRIVSATHRNLEEMIRAGQFREDLWFRLNVFPITIPPLRHRSVDIPALANHFIERKSREMKLRQVPPLAPGALARLQDYEWPGNVRELENIVERALILSQMEIGKGVLTFDTLAGDVTGHPEAMVRSTSTAIQPLEILITRHIENALKVTNGKVEGHNGAAQLLGLHPSTLRGRMRKLGIVFGKGRQP
jgi:transcriptional regulator with GAF, ATPase, and Fis domain